MARRGTKMMSPNTDRPRRLRTEDHVVDQETIARRRAVGRAVGDALVEADRKRNNPHEEVDAAIAAAAKSGWDILREQSAFRPKIAGQFETFDAWVMRASRTISEPHCPTDTTGQTIRAICVDAKGRRCQCGGDFMRARDEGAFPVVYFWEFENAA